MSIIAIIATSTTALIVVQQTQSIQYETAISLSHIAVNENRFRAEVENQGRFRTKFSTHQSHNVMTSQASSTRISLRIRFWFRIRHSGDMASRNTVGHGGEHRFRAFINLVRLHISRFGAKTATCQGQTQATGQYMPWRNPNIVANVRVNIYEFYKPTPSRPCLLIT